MYRCAFPSGLPRLLALPTGRKPLSQPPWLIHTLSEPVGSPRCPVGLGLCLLSPRALPVSRMPSSTECLATYPAGSLLPSWMLLAGRGLSEHPFTFSSQGGTLVPVPFSDPLGLPNSLGVLCLVSTNPPPPTASHPMGKLEGRFPPKSPSSISSWQCHNPRDIS